MKKWQIHQPSEEAAKQIRSSSDLSMLCAQVLAARGMHNVQEAAAFLQCDGLADPFLTADMEAAAACINTALDDGSRICIYGDYDCDGVTATVILYSYLLEMGADVTYRIPERDEGYGLNVDAVHAMHEDGVVDAHRADDTSPFHDLCGAGVALKLVAALDGGDTAMALEQFGELAAIATIADVVNLSGENRYLVQLGLRLLANTERVGLLALLEKSGLLGKSFTSTSVAFGIAPRINAAGLFGGMQDLPQMNYCKFRLALDIFSELGLVQQDLWTRQVHRKPVSAKVDLQQSVLLQGLQKRGVDVV